MVKEKDQGPNVINIMDLFVMIVNLKLFDVIITIKKLIFRRHICASGWPLHRLDFEKSLEKLLSVSESKLYCYLISPYPI